MADALLIFSGDRLRLEYAGPDPVEAGRVVIAFPPFDYPFVGPGWGTRSFAKRGIAHVSVFHAREDWYQHTEFFRAMAACRAFFDGKCALTTYGFSMGGYGAFLGAGAIGADIAVAVSPQFSIDPADVPTERRYRPQWNAMDGWVHEPPEAAPNARMVVLFDPLHRLDRMQERLIQRMTDHRRCLLHGAGHAGIQSMKAMGIIEVFFDLLCGRASEFDLRRAYRNERRSSFRYLRKVGTRAFERGDPMASHFLELARVQGFRRLVKKWDAA